MICQRCKQRPAEVHYTEVVGGQKTARWLCAVCAPAEGVLVPASSAPAAEAAPVVESQAVARLRCDQCGTTFAAIRRTGRVGCAGCYRVFRVHLEPLMRRVHRSLEHVGRHPARPSAFRRQGDLRRLREQLVRAIHDEDYERAARLRDEIHSHREGSPGSGSKS